MNCTQKQQLVSFPKVRIAELDRQGFPMSMVTYHSYLNMAIRAIDRILWGYTARDCMEIIKQFLP